MNALIVLVKIETGSSPMSLLGSPRQPRFLLDPSDCRIPLEWAD